MLTSQTTVRVVRSVLAVTIALAVANAAMADTIYLKNGRSILSSQVRVEGDRVIFLQYGGEVSIPMSMVDQIVTDAEVEPEGTPPPPPPAADPSPADPAANPADPEAPEIPPKETRDYWQNAVARIVADREEEVLEIESLRRTERAFLFSQRSTAETRAQIAAAEVRLTELDQEMTDLQTEARRLGIAPGWLRLDPSGGDA